MIVEDVITTGKSSLKIKDKNIVSQIKLEIPTYNKNNLPIELKKISVTKPGSRYLKWSLD